MKCSTCGTDNPANARFCGNCRQTLVEESTESAPEVSGIGVGTVEVSLIEAIKLGYKNYFTFSGRATRAELWWCRKGDEGPNKYGPDPRIATSQQP